MPNKDKNQKVKTYSETGLTLLSSAGLSWGLFSLANPRYMSRNKALTLTISASLALFLMNKIFEKPEFFSQAKENDLEKQIYIYSTALAIFGLLKRIYLEPLMLGDIDELPGLAP